jgi:hypothetical protein
MRQQPQGPGDGRVEQGRIGGARIVGAQRRVVPRDRVEQRVNGRVARSRRDLVETVLGEHDAADPVVERGDTPRRQRRRHDGLHARRRPKNIPSR